MSRHNPVVQPPFIGLLLAAGVLYGGLVSPQSPLWLEQKADLVVVGVPTAAVERGNTLNFSLQVSRVIKGNPALAGASIAAFWTSTEGASSTGSPNENGIWFLQQSSGAWRVMPLIQGAIDFRWTYFPDAAGPILSAYTYPPAASTEDKLASELSSAIEASAGYGFPFDMIFQNGLLDELKSPVFTVLYQRLAYSGSADKRLLGLSGLLRQGNAPAVAEAAQTASAAQGSRAESALLMSIRVYFRNTDPSAVAALGAAATDASDSSTAFREAAAHALAAIHTSAALPYLATLLDDPDQNLRVEAVGGMGAFANGLAVQTQEGVAGLTYLQLPDKAPYKTPDTIAHLAFGRQAVAGNEAYFVSFWRNWWSQNRASLGY